MKPSSLLCGMIGAVLAGCASNPYNVSGEQAALLVGRRAVLHPDLRGKEHVYFTQLNRDDLRDRWGDFPSELHIPPGVHTVLVACEWHSDFTLGAVATHVERIRHRFRVGHEYRFTSQALGDGMCKTSMEDVTGNERRLEAEQEAAKEEAKAEKAAAKENNKKKKKTTNARKR